MYFQILPFLVRAAILYNLVFLVGCELRPEASQTDTEFRNVLSEASISASIATTQTTDSPKIRLGQFLFFEKLMSGNQDTACATCHHPSYLTGDGLNLSVGTKGVGVGPFRIKANDRPFIPRNSPDLFNRGHSEWRFLFWDGRVSRDPLRGFTTPAGDQLPPGLDSVLAAQALFPLTARDEMRGEMGDIGVTGLNNELALYGDTDYQGIWNAILQRLMGVPEYQTLFVQAYPGVAFNQINITHVANAIAEFEKVRWSAYNSPFDQYLSGNDEAISLQAKKGGLLFYGKAGCSECHSGFLFTDQKFHNVAVPQLGPGKELTGLDTGRYLETQKQADKYAFRTPSLRNVQLTGPWLHNGAYASLEAVIRHMLDPVTSFKNYDVSQLPADLQLSVKHGASVQEAVLAGVDPLVETATVLTDSEFSELMAFIESLTDPSTLNHQVDIPAYLPSGLPID